jgi:hypothetical protein
MIYNNYSGLFDSINNISNKNLDSFSRENIGNLNEQIYRIKSFVQTNKFEKSQADAMVNAALKAYSHIQGFRDFKTNEARNANEHKQVELVMEISLIEEALQNLNVIQNELHKNIQVSFTSPAALKESWEGNVAHKDQLANLTILKNLIVDPNVSDSELYQFFQQQQIRDVGRWFQFKNGDPTDLAKLLMATKKVQGVKEFYQTQEAALLTSQLTLISQAWDENPSQEKRKEVLKNLFNNFDFSDLNVYNFLKDKKIRANGGWFHRKNGSSSDLAEALMVARNVKTVEDFYKKQEALSVKEGTLTEQNIEFTPPAPIKFIPSSPIKFIPSSPIEDLLTTDLEYKELQGMAKKMTLEFPPKIPSINFTDDERNKLAESIKAVQELEEHIYNEYGNELSNLGWHGRLSHQRILWQDESFVQAIQNPLNVKVILARAAQQEESSLGEQHTLSSLLLYGLKSNRISYLTTVAPSWCFKPHLEGITWSKLAKMALNIEKDELPRKVQPAYVENVKKGLKTLQQVLTSLPPLPEDPDMVELQTISDQISKASISDLLKIIPMLIKDREIAENLVRGVAGHSTDLGSMNTQCLEVMTEYRKLLAYHKGDHAAVLGYGLVSHALDARHLAAASYFLNSGEPIDQQLMESQETLRELLQSAESLDPEARDLIKIRLQQIIQLIVENRKKLNIPLNAISQVLGMTQKEE